MMFHSDKSTNNVDEAQENFQEISEAYYVLSYSKKRQIYDQYGEERLKVGEDQILILSTVEHKFTISHKLMQRIFLSRFLVITINEYLILYLIAVKIPKDSVKREESLIKTIFKKGRRINEEFSSSMKMKQN
jgi:curved DNA-binding protein CbpA